MTNAGLRGHEFSPTVDQQAALDAANSPDAGNEFLTRNDVFTGPSPTLADVLAAGNDAGAQGITNLADVAATSVTPTAIVDPTVSSGLLGQAPSADGAGSWAWQPKAVVSATDPGAIGPGNIWLRFGQAAHDTLPTTYAVRIRNDGDNGWLITTVGLWDNSDRLRGAIGSDIASGDTMELRTWDAAGVMRNDVSIYDGAGITRSRVLVGQAAGSEHAVEMLSNDDGGVGLFRVLADNNNITLEAIGGPQVVVDAVSINFTGAIFANLPTSNPGAGKLWNDTTGGFNIVKVGT